MIWQSSNYLSRDEQATKIRSLKIPLKIKVFVWLVLKKRILTTTKLVKRGWIDDSTCVLCGVEEETEDHLFTQCVFSKFIIVMGVDGMQPQDLEDEVKLVWDRWMGRKGRQKKRDSLTELVGCWWTTWRARNDTIFRKTLPNPGQAVYSFEQLLKEWDYLLPP